MNIISHDEKTEKRIDFLKNFGFANETTVIASGINAKMNEVQAAYGLNQLKYVDDNFDKRRVVAKQYDGNLNNIDGLTILKQNQCGDNNYPYYPIFIDENEYGISMDELYNRLKDQGIYTRRYFYPLVTEFPIYRGLNSSKPSNLINSHLIARQVICLPIYPELCRDTVERIANIIGQKK